MSFIFYIDSVRVDNPMNDMSLVTKISRDDQIGGIVITQDASLQWNKNNAPATGEVSAYNLLKTAFDDALCSEVDLEIYSYDALNTTYLKHKGVIKIPQLEFSEQELIITTKVQDNSFYSLIFNNRDLKVDFRATFTKNALDLTPLPFYTVDMFNGCTGGFTGAIGGAYYKGYLVTDIFAFIISAITDNQVGFQSDYLTSRTYPLMLFKGQSLLTSFTTFPTAPDPTFEISFQDLYKEINAIENLFWYIDNSDPDNPIFKLESFEDTFSTPTGVTIENPLLIKTVVDINTLWGTILTGSEITVDGDNSSGCIYTMNEALSLHGFKREAFYPKGQCNVNREYSTLNSWIVSNNVIQDILIGQSTNYIDDYVIVEVDGVDDVLFTANGYPHTFFGQPTPPFFYNLTINNMYKLGRHASHFGTVFGSFLGLGTLGFVALLGDDPSQDITYVTAPASHPNFITPGGITVPSQFPNDSTNGGYDGSGNYNQVTFQYTVPQDGDYSFHERIHFETNGLLANDYFEVGVIINHYDSGMVLKATGVGGISAYYDGFFFADGTLVTNAITGDIVEAEYRITYFPGGGGNQQNARTVTVIWDSLFECNGNPEGGISVAAGNPSVRNLLHDMEYSFSETEWRSIVAAPTGMIPFTKDGVTRYGWIKDISRSDQTGLAQIKLLSSNATS